MVPPIVTQSDAYGVASVIAGLKSARDDWRASHASHAEYGAFGFPSRSKLAPVVSSLSAALFPLRLGPPAPGP
jgi:serine O-acetyltransferase